MSNTPDGNICKVSANLGWASDTLAMLDKTMLKLSAEVKTILRERDNLQDQRDFAMGEIERLRKERDEARAALRFIAEWGGRTLESEYGDIDCNGKWCGPRTFQTTNPPQISTKIAL